MSFRPSKENHDWLRAMAIQEDRSVSWLINNAITQARVNQRQSEKEGSHA